MEPPKVTKKGDQVITSYVDEKTGRFTAYEVGVKLEVSDFSGQWFPAKIVEVDKGEKEVLVHFENWSARFDEWIKMDSNRLRPSPNTNIVKTHFKVGEQVEALWNTDGQRYPGVIQNILPNDYYQVLFDDGIKLKKKFNQIFKLKPATRKTGGASSSKKNTNSIPAASTSLLPELTPIPPALPDPPAKKSAAIPPPPLIPKPAGKGTVARKSISSNLSTIVVPKSKPSAKKSHKKSLLPLPVPLPLPLPSPVPSPSPPILSTPEVSPVVNLQNASPASPGASSDEPVSSKRKRTVQDYSALLRIRRRYPYQKEGEIEKFKRPRRGRSSPFSEPPELVPETGLPQNPETQPLITETSSEEKSKDATIEPDLDAEPKQEVTVATPPPSPPQSGDFIIKEESEQTLEPEINHEIPPPTVDEQPDVMLPLKPKSKPKRKFRPFNCPRRKSNKKPQRIIYVTVDDDEFAAAGGNLNKRNQVSSASSPGKVNLEAGESVAVGDASTPSTPSSVKEQTDESVTPTESPGDGPGPRIIKRRRRRTYARLAAAEGIGVETGSSSVPLPTPSSGDEPLSKRKRTIHDYSMLLKTRPKFFFDIDAEQERPGMQPTRKRRVSPSSVSTIPVLEIEVSSDWTPSAIPSTSDETLLGGTEVSDPVTEEASIKADEAVTAPEVFPIEAPQKSDTGSSVTSAICIVESAGPTSIATHRPVRRSSSQFARKSHIALDEIQVLSMRGAESGLRGSSATVVLENIDAKIESHTGRSIGSSGGRRGSLKGSDTKTEERRPSKPVERRQQSQLASKLNELDYNSLEEDEELLDIGYSGTAIGILPSSSKGKVKTKNTSISSSVPPTAIVPIVPSTSSSTHTSNRPKEVKKKPRVGSNQWWKRRQSAQNIRKASDIPASPTDPLELPPTTVPAPKARRITNKANKRLGDILSGLTLNRIRIIRNNLYKKGFRKRVIAHPAEKEVSVDIISCVCGSSDEHGLMVQCELCQCWQHGQCFEIETVTDMPKNYICGACLYPENVRSNKPFDYHYDFYKTGKLPRFGFAPPMPPKFSKLIQETNTLIQRLHQVRGIIHTSRVHMNLMEAKPDHPKLYQWDKPHQTIRESLQEKRFNKTYRPLLRRLLYFNRHDPNYVTKLRARVEQVVKRRDVEERKRAARRLNEKFPSIFPTPKPISVPPVQKQFGPASPTSVFKTPAIPPLSPAAKEAKRLEAEALRIRKELETLNKGNSSLQLQPMNLETVRVKSTAKPLILPSGNEASVIPKSEEDKDDLEVSLLMDDVLAKVETICEGSANDDIKPPLHIPQAPQSIPSPNTGVSILVPKKEPVVREVVDLGEEAPPEFPDLLGVDSGLPDIGAIDIKPCLTLVTDLNPTSTTTTAGNSQTQLTSIKSSDATSSLKVEQVFNDVDFMNLDPSDPKFSTIAADLVKSCCEEPESLIKTLEDLANVSTANGTQTSESVAEVEGNDHDLINFLDEALMEDANALPVPPATSAESTMADTKFILPPPLPQMHASNSPFVMLSHPPRLTRLTPELCRGNLMLTILDQQRIIDQHLDEIEARVTDIEKMRGLDASNRAAAFQRISSLQAKVKRMMREFELVKSIGRSAERRLREVIPEEPYEFDEGSVIREHQVIRGKDNEETDSADEDVEDEELSEELEDL